MGIVFWLVLMLVLLAMEASTLGLVTIWFAGGALITAIVSLFIDSIIIQLLIFVIVSAACLILIRPLLIDKVNANKEKTNIESIVDSKAKVKEKIDNFNGTGTVILNDVEWTARSCDDKKVIEKGACVLIKEVRGVKLIVEQYRED